MSYKNTILFLYFILATHLSFSQDCGLILSDVNNAIKYAQHNLDSTLNSSEQPGYIEAYLIYPVISRYYNKTKNKDTAFIRKFQDFERTVWCFKGTCFNNNRSFYLGKKEILDKIKNNDLKDSYQRETICMLCDKYLLDTMAIIKLMNYSDTSNNAENVNANNYSLLHKALQLTSFKANKCIGTSLFERYKFSLIDTIYNKFTKPYFLAKEENNISSANSFDLFSESLLMISILDDKINISDDLYNYVINSQLPNGGWGINNDNSGSNGHATIVSLWVLLDLHKKLISVAKMPK